MTLRRALIPVALVFTAIAAVRAEDPAIDNLLKKLPPPEKLVKPRSVQRTVQQPDPALKDPLVRQMLTELAHGNVATGLANSRALAGKYPKSAAAQEVHALIAYLTRQFGEASSALHRALEIQPKRESAHLGMVIVELAQKRPAAALPHARMVTELEPRYADGWLLLSGCEEQVGHREQSAAAARKAVQLAPSELGAWVQLARAENRVGNSRASLDALTKASEIAPDNAALQATVGFGYINVNHSADAVRPLSRAAQLAPRDYLIQSQLGYALLQAGQTDQAIDHLRRGASLKPSYGPVWEHLGFAYEKAGRYREARDAFQHAARLMPTNKVVQAHLAGQRAPAPQPTRR